MSFSDYGVPRDAPPELLGDGASALAGDPEALQQFRSGFVPFGAHAELLNALSSDLRTDLTRSADWPVAPNQLPGHENVAREGGSVPASD